MDLQSYLQDYNYRASQYLENYWHLQKQSVDTFAVNKEAIDRLKQLITLFDEYMDGGKKIRGALVQLGFECGGGNKFDVLPFSLGMEVLHSFMLMHDDVMDRDDIRRNKPTVHNTYGKLGRELGHNDSVHFGNSMAIVLGDLGCFWGAAMLSDSKLPAEKTVKGMQYLWNFLLNTGYGQALDMWNELADTIDESLLMQVHLNKTAYYTIAGPLQYGGILAGADQKQLMAMESYGKAVGVAFQLRDDELGLYGEAEKLGKPLGSDIKAGKNTLLKIKALELSSEEDQKFLRYAYGNPVITDEIIDRVREITKVSGALDYSEMRCSELIKEGKQFIEAITDDVDKRRILGELADYIYSRGK